MSENSSKKYFLWLGGAWRLPCFMTLAACLLFVIAPLSCAPEGSGGGEKSGLDLPDIGFEKVLFVKRITYVSDHFYTDFINGISQDHLNPDNGVYMLDLVSGETSPVITCKDMPSGTGIIGRFSLSFDATKLLFDFKPALEKGFRIWEVNLDGTGLRQITFEPDDEAERIERYSMLDFEDDFEKKKKNTKEEENEGACCWDEDEFCEYQPVEWCIEEDGEPFPGIPCSEACPSYETDGGDDDEDEGEEEEPWQEPAHNYNHHTDDMHPTYAPDGSILFTSTRAEYITLCDSEGFLTTPVLHRVDADGGNMEQLTRSPVSEFGPVPMPDGRILYTRWEYIDKGSVCIKGLWAMNPDGTNSNEVFGNNHVLPPTIIHGRPVPGDEHLVVAVGCPHFFQGGSLGTLMLIDTTKDIRTEEAFSYLTPDVTLADEPGWSFNGVDDPSGASGKLYTDPFPVRKDLFLASVKSEDSAVWTDPAAYDLHFLDDRGTHTKILDDSDFSLWQPTPLSERPTPTIVNPVRHPDLVEHNEALLIVSNVYEGMEGVEHGAVKWLRINEAVPRFWSSQRWQYGAPLWFPYFTSTSWYGALWVRVQWGIVPVEEDGSAHFTVPADRNIFLQALDENYMEVQRERTYVNYRPGEIRSCVGCHERTGASTTPPDLTTILAMQRLPSEAGPQPGEESGRRVIHYESDIQPIFDAKCTSCHGAENPSGGLALTGGATETGNEEKDELVSYFIDSYRNLVSDYLEEDQTHYLGYIVREGVHEMDWGEYLAPYSLGSHTSLLVEKLRSDPEHSDLLTLEEFIRLVTWVDSNAQYYGSYYGRHHADHDQHPNYRVVPTFEEAISPEAPAWHN